MISNNKLFWSSTRTLLEDFHNKVLLRGTWRLIKMAKWVLTEPTTDSVSAWDKVISSCKVTHSSQTFNGISRLDYQLLDTNALFNQQLLNLTLTKLSAWYSKDTLRNETKKFVISKLCFPWLVYTVTPSNSTQYYLTSSNLAFNTENKKKFPAEKKTTEYLGMFSVIWQSTLGEVISSHQRAQSSFMVRNNPGDWSYCQLLALVISLWNNHQGAERIGNRKVD